MSLNIPLLKKICEESGAPGFEKKIRDLVLKEIKSLVDEIQIDNIGNVIAIKRSGIKDAKKVMVAAHMDEIGFIITHIDDNGYLRFHPLGGFDPKTLTSQRVIVHGKKDLLGVMGSKPVHVMKPEEKTQPAKIENYFIDLGMSKEEVLKYVEVGSSVTREGNLVEMGDCVVAKSLDNRVSVFILIEVLKNIELSDTDLYAVFTVQEEVGLRGVQVAAGQINSDFGFALDTTIAYDTPGAPAHENITKLGEGVGIKLMDSSAIADYRMVEYMKKTATKYKIKWQPEILTAGGTDTAGIQRWGEKGAITGAVSIPTRHIHQVIETVHKEDIEAALKLLRVSIEDLNSFDWGY